MVDPARLLTVAEAGKLSLLSEPALRARINDGRLPAIRIGGHVYIDEHTFREFLKQQSSK